MTLRIMKILLVVSIAAWGFVNGVGNIMFYDQWIDVVGHVMAIENIEYDGQLSGRAITHPAFHTIGYAFIYLSKFATGIVCALGAYDLWRARRAAAVQFNKAKNRFYIGCGISMFMLIFGFLVLAGSFFSTGQAPSELAQGFHSFVSVYMVCIGFALLYVAIPDMDDITT
ncbi:MAG TPA: DUF2165 family protein [Cellvibrio sp.]|nr:DUF2165 family protein [Cellvibrio sp.]